MPSRRLLVVDDQPDYADIVRRVGERCDFLVETLHDSRDFEETYRRFDPTVIMLDVFMPEVDGIEIVRWLVESGNRAPVVLTTGYDAHYAEAAKVLGSLDGVFPITTLYKPTPLSDIEAAIEGRL